MKSFALHPGFAHRFWVQAMAAGLLTALVMAPAIARAGDPVFEQILPAKVTSSLLVHEGMVLRGIKGGGLLITEQGDINKTERLTSGQELSGNDISDLTWTGQNVWVATLGGGLTKITNLEGSPTFRPYTNNIGSLFVTSVTGSVLGGSERVFYGMEGGGVGQINSGLSGNIYTVDDGLISNNVTTLQIFQGQLFVGTPVGVSRFANNIFTDQNAGLTSLVIRKLALDHLGNLVAGGDGGVFVWDGGNETWTQIGDLGAPVIDLAPDTDGLYALGRTLNGAAVLSRYDGTEWSQVALPFSKCSAIGVGDDLWASGPLDFKSPGGIVTQNYLGRHLVGSEYETVVGRSVQPGNTEGVAFGADGTAWIGEWEGFHASGYDPASGAITDIYEAPHATNDTLNLFPNRGNMLGAAGAPDGTVYFAQYALGGVIKYNAATTGHTDLMDPTNSGLQGRSIINLAVHPDGPLIVMHDWADLQKVEILVDPDNWSTPGSWYLPPVEEGLGLGPTVWDALVERRDVIWFAVEDAGLVCWDINGPNAGPDDPLTWFDESDDVWYEPIGFFPDTSLDPGKTLGLATGRDGSIWAGGNGLVQFTYEIAGSTFLDLDVLADFTEKTQANPQGLVNGNVQDVAVDRNGDVWVATRTGLNRVTPQGDEYPISAWIDLGNFLGNPNYQVVYSSNVIAPLPGITYRRMAISQDGRQLVLSADQGSTLITVGLSTESGSESDPLAGVFCYPNPWTPGGDADQLSLGGLPTETVAVSVYNLEGQLVYIDNLVADQTGFWDGTNSKGIKVATGMYFLTIATGGMTTTRTVAVVQ